METNSSTMKFRSSVVTTSSTPNFVLRTAGPSRASAPVSIAAIMISGISPADGSVTAPVPITTVITAPR
jgi:hypothetical protein